MWQRIVHKRLTGPSISQEEGGFIAFAQRCQRYLHQSIHVTPAGWNMHLDVAWILIENRFGYGILDFSIRKSLSYSAATDLSG